MRRSPPRSFCLRPLLLSAIVWCATTHEGSAQAQAIGIANTVPGRLEYAHGVMPIGTSASGTVAQLLVREGERVERDQLLVRIDCTNLQKELDAKTSDLAAAEAALARVLNGPRAEEIAIGVANVSLAEARAEEASTSLGRSEGSTITEAQIDQAKRDARIAAAQLEEVRAKLAWLRAGSRQEDVAEARSKRDAAKALAEEAGARLGYCSVRAPVAGVIVSTNVTPGQYVSAAVPVTLIRLADDRRLRVRAEVDERDIGRICLKQRAVVAADAFPGTQLEATTERIGDEMSRRTMFRPDDPARKDDRDVREVTLSLNESSLNWPAGLRVSVRFSACPGGARGG